MSALEKDFGLRRARRLFTVLGIVVGLTHGAARVTAQGPALLRIPQTAPDAAPKTPVEPKGPALSSPQPAVKAPAAERATPATAIAPATEKAAPVATTTAPATSTTAPTATKESGDIQWIWPAGYIKDHVPACTVFFRRAFEAHETAEATVHVAADDRFELFVNGKKAGVGEGWRKLVTFDVTKLIVEGKNVVALRVQNTTGSSAAVMAAIMTRGRDGSQQELGTDAAWKAVNREFIHWQADNFNDRFWPAAQSFGAVGEAAPWGKELLESVEAVVARTEEFRQFKAQPDFRVERVLGNAATGSAIALAFNEFGEMLISRERGPLLLARDANGDGTLEAATYCDLVTGAQGILPLNGEVFVTADGPDGPALYRLRDEDRDRVAEMAEPILKFAKPMGEHGAHAVTLGPEGMIYVLLGNHAELDPAVEVRGPYHHPYEGDLLQPKLEDPSGHAAGIRAPGGVVLRTNATGSVVELFAGGLRNPYDIVFNEDGDLFTFDSDMEWDLGLPWYRPTRLLQLIPGGEYGWRSGWSNWPETHHDAVAPVLSIARGSPAGLEVYDHYKYPAVYHGAIFAADWSQGRILSISLARDGAGYGARSEIFLTGEPLNVTDLAVGPDGWLYFTTGGRGTDGGLFRVVHAKPGAAPNVTRTATDAVRQPQLNSAWARQQIASLQRDLGQTWQQQMTAIIDQTRNHARYRARAIDLLQWVGPFPETEKLVSWTHDPSPEIRARAAAFLGVRPDSSATARLEELLADVDPRVRRATAEAIERGGYKIKPELLDPLLADDDRRVAFAGRRTLESLNPELWREHALTSDNVRVFIGGATALMVLEAPSPEAIEVKEVKPSNLSDVPATEASGNEVQVVIHEDKPTMPPAASSAEAPIARRIVDRAEEWMQQFMSDRDFVDLLRTLELTLAHGNLSASGTAALRAKLSVEYPSQSAAINRELLRMLALLNEGTVVPRIVQELAATWPEEEKVHAALMATRIDVGWSTEDKLAVVEFLDRARNRPEAGNSVAGYMDQAVAPFVARFAPEEQERLLAEAARWPAAAIHALGTLPEHLSPQQIERLRELDRQMAAIDAPAARRLQTGIVAVLARSGDAVSMAHLREQFELWPDRRAELAMGLSQKPDADNWPLIVRALPVVDGAMAQEVLTQLRSAPQKPTEPEALRQVILCGLRLKENGAPLAIKLLRYWTNEQPAPDNEDWETGLTAWQKWFAEKHPNSPPAELPVAADTAKWSLADLNAHLHSAEGKQGDALRGAVVFDKAQCVKCHRFAGRGEQIGPDLSAVAQRFQKREILEAILFPSHVVSDQYAAHSIVTTKGVAYTGITAPAADGSLVVLQPNGEKVTLRRADIEETSPSRKSIMPDNLLDALSQAEIADLFAYLTTRPELAQRDAAPATPISPTQRALQK